MPCTRWGLPPRAIAGTETALIIADFSFLSAEAEDIVSVALSLIRHYYQTGRR